MDMGVLGPLRLRHDNADLSLGRPKQQVVLALLLMRSGEAVSMDELIEELWGATEPRSAVVNVRAYAAALRRLLHSAQPGVRRIVRAGSGYLLHAEVDELDRRQFEHDAHEGRRAQARGDLAGARRAFEKALSRWRGVMIDGLPRGSALASHCATTEHERLTVTDSLAETYLRLGLPEPAVGLMRPQIQADPLREQSYALLMRAIYQVDGAQSALEIYRSARAVLTEQLGIDPGPELQRLHRAVLSRDPGLDGPRSAAPAAGTANEAAGTPSRASTDPRSQNDTSVSFRASVPRTLPADLPDFAGREREIKLLANMLEPGGGKGTPVAVVTGLGGVGKTALCLHVAHRLLKEYVDGQLYADLHGLRPAAATPFDVLGRFLRHLGVDGSTLPKSLDERAELYRHLLADRRVLVVLDDAASEEQVIPLVPGSRTCGVLINTRGRFGSSFGAHMLDLEVMDAAGAKKLLTALAGVERTRAEPDAAVEMVRLCGYLPLAIRIAGGRLATKPHWDLRKLVDKLRDERTRLQQLAQGALDVRASITLSYHSLTQPARRLLCRLGHLDLAEVSPWLPSALLDTTAAESEEIVELLHDVQLIQVIGHEASGQVRYRLHDLVRLFARERAEVDEAPDELQATRRRVLGACLNLADAAHDAIYGGNYLNISGSTARWQMDPSLVAAVVANPLQWFDADLVTITALIRQAILDGAVEACWELASTLSLPFQMRRYFDEWQAVLDAAHDVVLRVGDRRGEAAIRYRMGWLAADRTDYLQSRRHFEAAASLLKGEGDRHGQAIVTAYLGMIERFLGNERDALANYRLALAPLSEFGDYGGAAFALRGIGQVHLQVGAYAEAQECFDEALATYRRAGSRQGAAQVMSWQGMLYLHQHRYGAAADRFQEALDIARSLGDRPGEAWCLTGLGRCFQQQGDIGRARRTLNLALTIVKQPYPTRLESLVRDALAGLE